MRPASRFGLALACLALACLALVWTGACSPGEDSAEAGSARVDERTLLAPLTPPEGRASVLLFVTMDCPIANTYAPELQAIIAEHAGSPLDFYLVYEDEDVSAAERDSHKDEYGYDAGTPTLSDDEQTLARKVGVTRTPEVAVVTDDGELSYRGRIDDRYRELARRRPSPSQRDLRDHLRALLDGELDGPVRTEAVGCLLPDVPAASD